MVKQTEAISRFLIGSTHSDLAKLYNENMEVQVNVAKDGGNRIEGEYLGKKWSGWSDDIQTWKPIRIPYNANNNPEYDLSKELTFDLTEHVEGIGMTGWDWVNRVSKWVAFDFDAIIGHSDKHSKKLSEVELLKIQEVVQNIPWVTLRYSTSGKGLHLYVFLNDVPTSNHSEHAALARSILGVMSAVASFDFHSKVDICGGNMWVWHRKMKGTNGLLILKEGGTFDEVPSNWRDHVQVVSGKKKKVVPSFIAESEVDNIENLFEELSGQRASITLDDKHKQLIEFLQKTNCAWWWDQDHNMLVAHTYDLKQAHEELGYKGIFTTIATGKEHGVDHNCFCYPLRGGGWVVRRYTPGVKETDTWDQDGNGWTRCYLNVSPDLKTAARAFGGIEDPAGGFAFKEAELAEKAVIMLGASLNIPTSMLQRETRLKNTKDGRVAVEIVHATNDVLPGWLLKGKKWQRVLNTRVEKPIEQEIGNYDDSVRHLVTESNENYGWVLKSDDQWRVEPISHVEVYLKALGVAPKDIDKILGSGIAKPWTIVNRPFQPEYIGDRQWNRKSAQLRFPPNQNTDSLSYPNWTSILNHIGHNLDETLKNDPWARSNGITKGADYLKCWLASLIQCPSEPLPYLFLYGNQNCGKSILHEALHIIIDNGIHRADQALVSQSGFNAEIEHAVLCVIEETDLRMNKMAYNRVKDWVTSRQLPIHRKGQTPYTILNTSHWIHCANERSNCPLFAGDARITMLHVDDLDPMDMIPKRRMLQLLEKEAPDFIAALLNLEIPQSNDRLNVPVIETPDKLQAAEANQSLLEQFLAEKCHYVTGEMIKISEFYNRFREWCDPAYVDKWTKIRIGREMPVKFPKGRNPKDGQFCYGNMSWTPHDPSEEVLPALIVDGKEMLVAKCS